MSVSPKTSQADEIKKIVDPEIGDFIEKKEQKYNHIFKPKLKKTPNFSSLLLVLLILSVVGLGSYLIGQLALNQQSLQRLESKNSNVAGASQTQNPKPISGAGFTILPGINGVEYKLTRTVATSEILPNRVSINSQLFLMPKQDSPDFEVMVVEYDNKYNQEQFTAEVLKFLGPEYSITNKNQQTAKNDQLWKLESTQKNTTKYYTFVTTSNYYFIAQRSNPETTATNTKFMENVVGWLYLN